MSKIIKYNDYIQINPDERILSLDKKEKIVLIDNAEYLNINSSNALLKSFEESHKDTFFFIIHILLISNY